ncbi:enamine deaminase RidA, partial [Mesorhizobium ephedrae]
KFTIYLTDESNLEGFMTSGISLPSPPPAATLLFVKALASPQLLIEIEAVAVR